MGLLSAVSPEYDGYVERGDEMDPIEEEKRKKRRDG